MGMGMSISETAIKAHASDAHGAAPRHTSADTAEVAAAALLAAVVACLAWVQLGWLLGWRFSGVQSLCAGAVALSAVMALATKCMGRQATLRAAVTAAMCALVSLALAAVVKDYSYDGQRYHQQAVLALAGGWNPLRDQPLQGANSLWINGYAKGPWTWSAAWFDATGSIELGKSLHVWLAASAGLLAYGALLRLTTQGWLVGRAAALWIAVLAAVNPVFLYQWPTHMNDSLVGSLLLALASQAARLALSPFGFLRTAYGWLAAGLALALLPTLKSSGLAYALLACVAAFALALLARRVHLAKSVTLLAAASMLPAALLLGWNPYVTNTLRHGHPFYPLAGTARVDIISGNSPARLQEAGRVAQLLGSLFSESHSELGASDHPAFRLKWPGVASGQELSRFSSKTDMRIGGFGPWFSLGLMMAFAAAAAAVAAAGVKSRTLLRAAALPAAILALTLAFPEPWWARYVPQMYLLPLALVAAVLATAGRGLWGRGLAVCTLVVLSFNSLTVGGTFAAGTAARELDVRTQLASLARISSANQPLAVKFGDEPSLGLRLSSSGVHWRHAVDSETCGFWVTLYQSGIQICLPPGSDAEYQHESRAVLYVKSLLHRN